MAEPSPERSPLTPCQRAEGLLVSPDSIYRKKAIRPIVNQSQRMRSSVSPASSRGARPHLRYTSKEFNRGSEAGRHASPLYSGRWDLSLSMIEEKRSPRKRRSKRYPTAVEEGLLTVKGMAPAVCLSTFSPLLLSSVIMRKNLLPPRITAYSSLPKKASQLPQTPAHQKRYSTASPQKRRPARPKTSHLDWDLTPNRKNEDTFDEVAAWD